MLWYVTRRPVRLCDGGIQDLVPERILFHRRQTQFGVGGNSMFCHVLSVGAFSARSARV